MENGVLTASCYSKIYGNSGGYYHNAVTKSKRIGERKILNKTKDKNDNRNIEIIRLLYSVGMNVTSVGFYYFYDAIHICLDDVLAATNAQKNIYMVLAEKYCVNYKSIERAMRIAFTDAVSVKADEMFKTEMHICSMNQCEIMNALEFVCLAALAVSNPNQ